MAINDTIWHQSHHSYGLASMGGKLKYLNKFILNILVYTVIPHLKGRGIKVGKS